MTVDILLWDKPLRRAGRYGAANMCVNALSSNYRGATDELESGKHPTVNQARHNYPPRNGITIIADPLDICDGGFRDGTVFCREEWQSMLMNCALVDGTLVMDRGILWQVYTYTNYRGTQRQKKRRIDG